LLFTVYSLLNFYLPTYNNRLKSVSTFNFNNLGNELVTTKEYYYENPEHLNPTLTISNLSDGKVQKTVFKYPSDYLPFSNDCKSDYEAILDSCTNFYNVWSTEMTKCLSLYGAAYEVSMNCESIEYACYSQKWGFVDHGHRMYAFGYPFSKCRFYQHCVEDFNDNLISNGYYDCLDTNNYISCQVNANVQYNNCLTNYYNSISELYETTTDPFFKGVYLLAANNYQNTLIEKIEYINDQEIAHYKFNYTEFDTTHLPILVKAEKELSNTGFTTDMVYNNYDNHLNVSQTTPFGIGSPSSYIWGYRQLYPVIVGQNVTLTDLNTAVDAATENLDSLLNVVGNLITGQQKELWNHFNSSLRNHALLKNALISTYTYNPLIGLTSQTDPKGISTFYEYDFIGRLSDIRDNNSNILEHLEYNYQQNELELAPDNFSFPYTGGGAEVQITSNSEWELTENISWISINGSPIGNYNGTISFYCEENTDTIVRSSQISVSCGEINKSITVNQAGFPYLNVEPQSVFFFHDGGVATIYVQSNVSWQVGIRERETWISIEIIDESSFNIKCEPYSGPERSIEVWVQDTDEILDPVDVQVTQK
jgi:YD repeat-containing protein